MVAEEKADEEFGLRMCGLDQNKSARYIRDHWGP